MPVVRPLHLGRDGKKDGISRVLGRLGAILCAGFTLSPEEGLAIIQNKARAWALMNAQLLYRSRRIIVTFRINNPRRPIAVCHPPHGVYFMKEGATRGSPIDPSAACVAAPGDRSGYQFNAGLVPAIILGLGKAYRRATRSPETC